MAACTRQPTRPAPVPAGRAKGKKRRAEDALEDKTEVLEEGELAAWFLNEMDQATQTDPVPYAPVDRPGVWMCPLHPDEALSEGRKDEFVYVYCPRDTCPVFSPQDRVDEWMTMVAQQLHDELRQRWDELTCFCDRRLSLRKSGSEKNPQSMYLACRDGSCRCFLWLNLPLSGKMRRRVHGEEWSSSLPQGQTRVLGRPSAGRGRVGDQGVHDVRQWVQHPDLPGHFRRTEVSHVDARRLGGVSRGQHAGGTSSRVAVGVRSGKIIIIPRVYRY